MSWGGEGKVSYFGAYDAHRRAARDRPPTKFSSEKKEKGEVTKKKKKVKLQKKKVYQKRNCFQQKKNC